MDALNRLIKRHVCYVTCRRVTDVIVKTFYFGRKIYKGKIKKSWKVKFYENIRAKSRRSLLVKNLKHVSGPESLILESDWLISRSEAVKLFAIYMVNNRTWLYPLTYFVFKKSVNIDSRSWEKKSIIHIKYNRSNLTSICHFLFPSPLSRDPSFFLLPYSLFSIALSRFLSSYSTLYLHWIQRIFLLNCERSNTKQYDMKTSNSWYFLIDGPKGMDGKRAGYKRYRWGVLCRAYMTLPSLIPLFTLQQIYW